MKKFVLEFNCKSNPETGKDKAPQNPTPGQPAFLCCLLKSKFTISSMLSTTLSE